MAALSFDSTRVIPFLPGSYRRVLEFQHALVEQRSRGGGQDAVLLGQHERVVTLGRGTRELPADLPIPVETIERGGDVTWHGPGQLVGYPILHLKDLGLGVRDYLRGLEAALIRALQAFGLDAERRDGATGVWVGAYKLVSIGVAVRRHVSYHGFALNVDPDLSDFQRIQPCGFSPEVMNSMAGLLPQAPSMEEVTLRVLQALTGELKLCPPVWETAMDSSREPSA